MLLFPPSSIRVTLISPLGDVNHLVDESLVNLSNLNNQIIMSPTLIRSILGINIRTVECQVAAASECRDTMCSGD